MRSLRSFFFARVQLMQRGASESGGALLKTRVVAPRPERRRQDMSVASGALLRKPIRAGHEANGSGAFPQKAPPWLHRRRTTVHLRARHHAKLTYVSTQIPSSTVCCRSGHRNLRRSISEERAPVAKDTSVALHAQEGGGAWHIQGVEGFARISYTGR